MVSKVRNVRLLGVFSGGGCHHPKFKIVGFFDFHTFSQNYGRIVDFGVLKAPGIDSLGHFKKSALARTRCGHSNPLTRPDPQKCAFLAIFAVFGCF